MKWFKALDLHKKFTLVILILCISGAFLAYLVRPYRGTWIYQYGNLSALALFYGGVVWSFINTIFLISKHKKNLRKQLIWIVLSAIPFVYIAIMMTIAMTRDYDLDRNF